jgi:predicted ATPase/DNA-binding CsgD family transcriptional regulator
MHWSAESALDPIVGRADELAAVAASLATSRLVTLTGLGGIGKTTLASAFDADRQDDGAVAFVDLTSLRDPGDVPEAIAAELAIGAIDTPDALAAVLETLARHPHLLVLDNFEHLLPARDVVRAILAGAPSTRILLTSRVALELDGERTIPLAPLAVPDTAANLETAAASRLFLRRAREGGGMRAFEPADREAVVEICRSLEGVPLAIELASAWCRVLTPRAILRRLGEQRLHLADEGRGRQATMDRVLATTLDLLSPSDRDVFEALSLFVAGFDERDARELGGLDDVLTPLRRLEAFALVQAHADLDGEPRFRMLETIRTAAAERLAARPDTHALRRRFVELSARHAQSAADALRDVEPGRSLAWMAAEAPNLRAALEIATAIPEPALAVQLAMTLATYGVRAGNARDSLRRLRAAMELGAVPPGIRSEALCAVVNLSWMTREPADFAAMASEAVDLAREAGDARREARALVALGSFGRQDEAVETLTSAIDLATRIDYQWAVNAAVDNLASLHADAGRWKAALELSERSAESARRSGDVAGVGSSLCTMADLNARLGRRETALALALEATLATRETWPNSSVLASTLAVLATCEALNGRDAASVASLAEACEMTEFASSDRAVPDVLEASVAVLARRKPALAARAAGHLEAVAAAGERTLVWNPVTLDAVAAVGRVLGPRRLDDERRAGRAADGWALLAEVRAAAVAARQRETRLRVEFGSLTPREVDVLGLLARGRTDAEIAAELRMSPKTASVHVANIKGKLGVQTRVEAAMRAQALIAAPTA